MSVIEYVASNFDCRKSWNDNFGYIPEKPITYVTHAFLHNSSAHLGCNMAILLFFGWFSEKWWGIPWTVSLIGFSILFSGWATGHLAGTEKWPDEINPVGFSHAAQTLLVTGTYAAVTAILDLLQRKLPEIAARGKLLQASPILALFLALAVCGWSVSGQATWNPTNETGQVAHSAGALIGGIVVLFAAMTRQDKNTWK